MLQEAKVLVSVEILPQDNSINVRWDNQILRDGNVIFSEAFRRAYGRYDREQFLADVPDGEAYADSAGLEPSANEPSPSLQSVP